MTQEEYLEILFQDLGFSGIQRKIWLESEYGVRYTDELNKQMKSSLINRLKEMKED